MKRPFAVIGITYLTAQAAACFIGEGASLALGITIILVSLLYFTVVKHKNTVVFTVLITAALSVFWTAAYTHLFVDSVSVTPGQSAFVSGRVAEAPEQSNGRFYYIIDTDRIDIGGVRQKTRIRLSSKFSLEADYADTVSAVVSFNRVSSEGFYSNKLSLLSRGIKASAYLPDDTDYSVTDGRGGLYGAAVKLRNSIIEEIDSLYTDESGAMLKAMITSDESFLSHDTLSSFRSAGISHILAVSGLHMSLISAALVWLLRRLHLGRRTVSCIVCAAVWFYIAIAGFPRSAMRAGIMLTVMLFGIFIDRLHTPVNSLGFALLVICTPNPYSAVDIGLLLSVSATLGLIVVAPRLNRQVKRYVLNGRHDYFAVCVRMLFTAFVTSMTASLSIAPVTALVFNQIPLLAPFVNALLSPFIMAFLTIGIISVILGALGPVGHALAYPLMTADWIIGRIIRAVAQAAAKAPGSVFYAGRYTGLAILCVIALLIAWVFLFRKYRQRVTASAGFAVLLCVFALFASFLVQRFVAPKDTISIFSTDNSTSVMVRHRKSAVLIGAGGSEYDVTCVYNEMAKSGTPEITALVLPSLSGNFASHADVAAQLLKPDMILCAGGGVYDDLIKTKLPDAMMDCENKTVLLDNVEVTMLSDSSGSVWTIAKCGDIKALIAPEGGNCLDCPFDGAFDVFVLPEDMPSNLTAIETKAVVVSSDIGTAGRDVSRVGARGFQNIYSTATEGTLTFSSRGGELYIGGID